MYIHDYDLSKNEVTLVDQTEAGDDIYCEIEYIFDTFTDYYWYSPDGYHEMEVPYLEFDDVRITSCKMFNEEGSGVAWGIDREEAEEVILGLLRENRELLEAMLVEDY